MDNELPILPIADFRETILAAVDSHQVTIITAETGAGKSTQVPQYLAEHGYEKIIVTQPRILAARNLSKRVREEWAIRTGRDSDAVVGYRTAHERDDHPDTTILYCTDGLQLVRELTGSGISDRQILVLDEVHEWNENMEVLIAWAKKRCDEDPRFKVLIMSATIETDSLADYFNTTAVINVPGRSYPVKQTRGTDIVSEIINQLGTGSNMLVFLPGKAEIENVSAMIKKPAAEAGVPILPLHSQLDLETQQLVFGSYPSGKVILSTNISQTSITIDDIDVVIDSGLERRSEVRSGVEGLFIGQTSQADCAQRAGRAGRTKPGEYILAQFDDMPCLEIEERPSYATPEILRKHIDRLTLRLANVGIDIELLDFFHDPSRTAIKRAKRLLVTLGALTKNNDVTGIGRQMERFPVESSFGRMLVEAQEYPKAIQAKLAAIIAIQEVGGIIKGGSRFTGWRHLTRQTKSDLLAQYDVWLALPSVDPTEYEELGIIARNIAKSQEVMDRLRRDLALEDEPLTKITADETDQLCRCIVAGQIHQLWSYDPGTGDLMHIATGKHRELSSSSVLNHPQLVSGTPFDLEIPTPKGDLQTLHLLQGATVVRSAWLQELAPDSFKVRPGKVYYDSRRGQIAKSQTVVMKGRKIEGSSQPMLEDTPQNRKLFAELYAGWLYEKLESERDILQRGYNRRLHLPRFGVIKQEVRAVVDGSTSLEELSARQRTMLGELGRLSTYVGEDTIAKIEAAQSKRHGNGSKFRLSRGKKPPHKRKYDRRRD